MNLKKLYFKLINSKVPKRQNILKFYTKHYFNEFFSLILKKATIYLTIFSILKFLSLAINFFVIEKLPLTAIKSGDHFVVSKRFWE